MNIFYYIYYRSYCWDLKKKRFINAPEMSGTGNVFLILLVHIYTIFSIIKIVSGYDLFEFTNKFMDSRLLGLFFLGILYFLFHNFFIFLIKKNKVIEKYKKESIYFCKNNRKIMWIYICGNIALSLLVAFLVGFFHAR